MHFARSLAWGVSLSALSAVTPALAQESSGPSAAQQGAEASRPDDTSAAATGDEAKLEEIVVTGSRIRRSTDTTSSAPVAVIAGQAADEKGYTQVGDVLNEMTSMAPSREPIPSLSDGSPVIGQDYPNLFNLGPARTLSLLNGRRMAPTSSGLGDEAVDTNIIPIGLLQRIDVVQGGGAAVYGSGAIAGVVNYVLKRDYNGQELQAQYGMDERGDYSTKSVRGVIGRNFANGRGNIALELDYSENSWLTRGERWNQFPGYAVPNPAPGAGTNGVPASIFVKDNITYLTHPNGVVVTSPHAFMLGEAVQVGGLPVTINGGGEIDPRYLGDPVPTQILFLSGGSEPYQRLRHETLIPPVKRKIATVIGSYDLTDSIRVSGEFHGSKIDSASPRYEWLMAEFLGAYGFAGYNRLTPLPFTSSNPYLTDATVEQLSALQPGFASGQPLYLAKSFINQSSKYADARFSTETLRGVLALDGNFQALGRQFYWDLSYSRSRVSQTVDAYHLAYPNVINAANAVRNGAGEIVCAINVPVVTDPSCSPLNIFGTDPIPEATLEYIFRPSGNNLVSAFGDVVNNHQDLLATFSGDFLSPPAGQSKFSLTYEYRRERASFTPLPGDQEGIFFSGVRTMPASGAYNTNEYAAELELPLLGNSFAIPLVKALDLTASYRYVQNSLAGSDSVWGVGSRWNVGSGLVLRATRSRNFRAPSITQTSAPTSVSVGGALSPCSNTAIGSGPNPSVRAANCLTLFTANPTFGLNQLPAGVPNTPQNRLANFANTSVAQVQITTSGNPDLENEIAKATTFGFVFEPRFVPGLVISADMLRMNLDGGLALFNVGDFANACFDTSPQPAQFCNAIGFDEHGQIKSGPATTVNAGRTVLRSEIYNVDYRVALDRLSSGLSGSLNLTLQATHNKLYKTTLAGTTTRTDGTVGLPKWVLRFDARYRNGPLGLNYSFNYLPASLLTRTSTVENSTDGIYKLRENLKHDVSVEYGLSENLTFRVGINNLTDEMPSSPSFTYGDIVGRNAFVSARISY